MGFYSKHIGPRLVTCVCGGPDIASERARVVPDASGVVLEIGIGPGYNLDFYDPGRVRKVIGVDPIASFTNLGKGRHKASRVPLELMHAPAEQIPLDARSIDTAVITFTLCSVDDPEAALAEVHRVLKPNGRVLFLEHGLAEDARVAAWQQRLNPMWKRLAVGCNLTRPIVPLIEASGFKTATCETHYLPSAPKSLGCIFSGQALIA